VIQDFETLTIRDSLLLAAASHRDEQFWRLGRTRADAEVQGKIEGYLEYFQFENPDRHALSAGEKKLLDIIRCLLVRPRFLLLDEPTAGLPQWETDKVKELVRRLGAEGEMSILIIEHDLELMWSVCDFVHFMAEGKVLLQGSPTEIRSDPTVIEMYLGSGHA
jgi:ABC-type branched-subunit amino acid transport system ATPase component